MPKITSKLTTRLAVMMLWLLGFVFAAFVLLYFIGDWIAAAPRYTGSPRPHFDGKTFFNPASDARQRFAFFDFVKWRFTRTEGKWESLRDTAELPVREKPPERVGNGEMRVTFINHATVLIQTDSLNILTDPIWSERCSPVSWAGPKRVRPAGIRFEDLPPIDIVLISHNHYDHLDIPTLKRLAVTHAPDIYTGLGNKAYLESESIPNAHEMDWGDHLPLFPNTQLHCTPVQHFSGRGLSDRDATLWCGFVLETPSGNIYFAGDTGYGAHFKAASEQFGNFRLALLPIGAYLPRWFMSPVHVSPEEAVQAHRDLRAETSMAIHFGTFPLADDGETQPVETLQHALSAAEYPPPRFWVLGFGEGRAVPPVSIPAASAKVGVAQSLMPRIKPDSK